MQWGGDFRWMNAFANFQSLDRLIKYVNEKYGDKWFVKYSTPSDYIDGLASQNVVWPTRYQDMFPYSTGPQDVWAGFYTSRANYKSYVRKGSHVTHASNQLYSEQVLNQATSETEIKKILDSKYTMLDTMGVNQHHDAVSGTSKQLVADDYVWRIWKAMKENSEEYTRLVTDKVKLETGMVSNGQGWR